MSYLSIEFGAIFVLFFLVYWAFRPYVAVQNLILLISSYLIVGLFNINFALILGSYTAVIYLLSSCIVYSPRPKLWLVSAVVVAIGNLAVFKYFNFLRPNSSINLRRSVLRYHCRLQRLFSRSESLSIRSIR